MRFLSNYDFLCYLRENEYKHLGHGEKFCPKCTEINCIDGSLYYKVLVRLEYKKNKKTNDWFYGCSNFPKCKYSENKVLTEEERQVKIESWANAQCGPHF